MEERILIVDDEKSIVDPIAYVFRREGFFVEVAFNGKSALQKIATFNPKVILLDVMMPEMNGFDVLRSISDRKNVGVIFLTAKNDIVDRVLGLELGADDYITKPFDIREIVARVKSLIRRLSEKGEEANVDRTQIGDFSIEYQNRKVHIGDVAIFFTPKEFDLMAVLIKSMGRVYAREELLDIVWGMDYFGGTRTVDIHVQRIRKKLGMNYQNIITTVHGVGYRAEGQ